MVKALFPAGAATDESARSQTAADAAALAGAENLRGQWEDLSEAGTLAYDMQPDARLGLKLRSGQGNAASYADRNGARLLTYDEARGLGRTYAQVQNKDRLYDDHDRAMADATAQMKVNFTSCHWLGVVPQGTLSSGPPTFPLTLMCGEWSAVYTIQNGTVLCGPEPCRTMDTVGPGPKLVPRLVD